MPEKSISVFHGPPQIMKKFKCCFKDYIFLFIYLFFKEIYYALNTNNIFAFHINRITTLEKNGQERLSHHSNHWENIPKVD